MKKNVLMLVVSLVAAILLAACGEGNEGLVTIVADSGSGVVSEAGIQTDAGLNADVKNDNIKSCRYVECPPAHSCNQISGVCEETRSNDAGTATADAGQQDVGTPDAGQCVPQPEICDGKDNDCNSVVDNVSYIEIPCFTGLAGECASGNKRCINGQEFCEPWNKIIIETCDSLDNDCDGLTDEGCECKDSETRICGSNIGECKSGTQLCVNGHWADCQGGKRPSPDICDSLDNNCDGVIDEGCECRSGASRACGISVGECRLGTQPCINGKWDGCQGGVNPITEICDNKDNDCDGQTDEDFPSKGMSCTVHTGECRRTGVFECREGGFGVVCDGFQCWTSDMVCIGIAGRPSPEICDGKDNDCDGQTDEDFPSKGMSCTVHTGECRRTGVFECREGGFGLVCDGFQCWTSDMVCSVIAGPASAEVCDGKDNDCDGLTDEVCNCVVGQTRECGTDVGECAKGWQECVFAGDDVPNAWSPCIWVEIGGTYIGPKSETCDNKDNDCDGQTDEDNVCPSPDAGQPDVGAPDAGQPDIGTADAGHDAGTVDSGSADAGPICTLADGGSPGTATWRLTYATQGGVTATRITVRSCNSSLYLTFNNTSSVEVTFAQDNGFTSCFQVDVDINGDGIMNFGAGDRWLCNYWQGTSRLDGEGHLYNPCNRELTVQVIETSGAANCRAQ